MWLWSAGLHPCTIGLSKVYIVILLIIGIQDLFLLITSKMLNIFENWIVSWWNYRHHKDCSLWKTVSTWESMLHCSTWFLFKFYTSMFAWLLKFFPLSNKTCQFLNWYIANKQIFRENYGCYCKRQCFFTPFPKWGFNHIWNTWICNVYVQHRI